MNDPGGGVPARRVRMTRTGLIYVAAAFAEIAGCFSFWLWMREGQASWWLAPGLMSLALFAWLLTVVDSAAAGRAYAAYGGVYILASLVWLWAVEGVRPDRWDVIARPSTWLGHPSSFAVLVRNLENRTRWWTSPAQPLERCIF